MKFDKNGSSFEGFEGAKYFSWEQRQFCDPNIRIHEIGGWWMG